MAVRTERRGQILQQTEQRPVTPSMGELVFTVTVPPEGCAGGEVS